MDNDDDGDKQPQTKISCIECRRLKRKCDRIHPCNQCRRYDKTCVFPDPEVPRRGKLYLQQVKGRVEHLERLLATHAPHVNPDTDTDTVPLSPTTKHSPREYYTAPNSHDHGAGAQGSPRNRPGPPGSNLDGFFGPPPPSPALPHKPPFAMRAPQSAARTTYDHPTGGSGASSNSPLSLLGDHPTSSTTSAPPPQLPPAPRPPAPLGRAPSFSGSSVGRAPIASSTADRYERQPRSAAGYEWNERQSRRDQGNDGTASLSVEPDGEGYLGFASGATLLRILQLTAGGVSLAHLPTQVEPPPPIPLAQWRPSERQRMMYIDAYFEHYHTQYPIVHEPTFRAQLAEVIGQPPRRQWVVLLNVISGLGAFCASQPMWVIDAFLERATSAITADHLETGSLVLVQAFTLLSNLAQKRNKPNAGSTYLGIAVRMAIGLGLHRELPLWNIKPFEREVRRRVWWVVYIFDSGASITFGRPVLLPYGEADVHMVHNTQDRDFTPSSPEVPPASRETTVYSSLIYQASFHLVGNRVYDRVISTPPPAVAEVMALDADLTSWYADLPEWMTASTTPDTFEDTHWLHFSAHKLFWRYANLRIILTRRAFLEKALKGQPMAPRPASAAEGEEVVEEEGNAAAEDVLASVCLRCAMDTIHDIHGFFKDHTLTRLDTWYGLHFLFQASFVPLIALHTDLTSPDRDAWQASVRATRETLATVPSDPLAQRCLAIIDILSPRAPPAQPTNPALPAGTDVQAPVGFGFGGAAMDGGSLLELFQANPVWQGSGADIAQDLLPFADLATLMSFWPDNSTQN